MTVRCFFLYCTRRETLVAVRQWWSSLVHDGGDKGHPLCSAVSPCGCTQCVAHVNPTTCQVMRRAFLHDHRPTRSPSGSIQHSIDRHEPPYDRAKHDERGWVRRITMGAQCAALGGDERVEELRVNHWNRCGWPQGRRRQRRRERHAARASTLEGRLIYEPTFSILFTDWYVGPFEFSMF